MAVWTSPDWSLPVETSLYTDVLDYIDFRLDDLATGLVDTLTKTYTNLPVNTQRWNSTSNKWEKWNGSSWVDLSTTYAISISGTATNITGTLAVSRGGTNITSYTTGDLIFASAATTLAKLTAPAVGKVLISNGVATAPSWGSVDLETHTAGILPVSKGGTGTNTITGLVYGNGTSDFSSAANFINIDTVTSAVTLAGSLKLNSNSIQSSTATAITLAGADVTVAGDLTVSGNDIRSSSGTALTLNGTNVTVQGSLSVPNNTIITNSININSSAPTIWFYDSDQADFAVHVNSNLWYVLNEGGSGILYTDQTGNLVAAGNVTAYSDKRLKSNITTIDNALQKTCKLTGVYFDKDGKRGIGLIAQDTQEVIPEAVQINRDYLSLAYGNLVGLLIEAIKELNIKVERLENAG